MAEKTKGKGKKKSKGPKEQPSETKTSTQSSTKKSKPAKKTAKYECGFCGKLVNNAHNLKVHEHHCKSKIEEREKKDNNREIESAVRKLKDEFEDQRDLFQKEATDREDQLRQELEELKDILRLEIRRTHHDSPQGHKATSPELQDEEIPDVTAPVAPDNIIPEKPESISEIVESSAEEKVIEPAPIVQVVTPPMAQAEAPPPQPQPMPEEPIVPVQELAKTTPLPETVPPSPQIPSENVAPMDPDKEDMGVSRQMVLDLIKEEIGTMSSTSTSATPISDNLDDRLGDMENKIRSLSSSVDQMARDIKTADSNTSMALDDKLSELDPKRFDREIEKISDRVFDIMDEIGYGESLNVAKIPPNILEIVYMATLADIVKEMNKALGDQEAENKINKALEDVRLRTSGSELFRFDGRRVVTENLARSIETNMISAKQIQTTYTELLKKLLETIPGYKAKNFQAMIKIKSQEYAVDKATVLSESVSKLESNMNNMGQMIAAFSSQLSARALQLEGDIKQNKEDIDGKSDKTDIENLLSNMMERAEADRSMRSNLEALKEELDAIKELSRDLSQKLEDYISSGSKKPVKKPKGEKAQDEAIKEPEIEEKTSEERTPESEAPELEKPAPEKEAKMDKKKTTRDEIIEAVSEGSTSKTAIKKKLKITDSILNKELAALVKEKKILKKGTKNRPSYAMPELSEDVKKAPKEITKDKSEKPASKKKVAGAKEEPSKKDEEKPADKKKSSAKKKEKLEQKEERSPVRSNDGASDKSKKKEEAGSKAVAKKKDKEKPVDDAEIDATPTKPAEKPKAKAKAAVETTEATEEKDTPSPEKVEEDLPPSKTLEDLDDAEKKVLSAISSSGITLPNLKKAVAKDVKYTVVLRALRVLLDSEFVEAVTQGRHTVYQKINVKKMDKTGKKKDKQEVK